MGGGGDHVDGNNFDENAYGEPGLVNYHNSHRLQDRPANLGRCKVIFMDTDTDNDRNDKAVNDDSRETEDTKTRDVRDSMVS